MSTFSPPTNKNNEVLTPLTNVLFSRARSDSDGAGSRRRATAVSYDGRGNADKQLDIRLPVWDSDIVKCQKKIADFRRRPVNSSVLLFWELLFFMPYSNYRNIIYLTVNSKLWGTDSTLYH